MHPTAREVSGGGRTRPARSRGPDGCSEVACERPYRGGRRLGYPPITASRARRASHSAHGLPHDPRQSHPRFTASKARAGPRTTAPLPGRWGSARRRNWGICSPTPTQERPTGLRGTGVDLLHATVSRRKQLRSGCLDEEQQREDVARDNAMTPRWGAAKRARPSDLTLPRPTRATHPTRRTRTRPPRPWVVELRPCRLSEDLLTGENGGFSRRRPHLVSPFAWSPQPRRCSRCRTMRPWEPGSWSCVVLRAG
jgi:hypothetical protein